MIRRVIAVALAATAITGGRAEATTQLTAGGTAVRDVTDVRSARAVCFAAGVGDVALVVITHCGFSGSSDGFTTMSAGSVAVATSTPGFGETPETLCWGAYAIKATDPAASITVQGCRDIEP